MWETSKRPARVRTATCSGLIPSYCTGISQPAKGTSRAPAAAWRSYRAVRRRVSVAKAPDPSGARPGNRSARRRVAGVATPFRRCSLSPEEGGRYPRQEPTGKRLADFRLFASGQPIPTALDSGSELLEVHFQGVEDVVRVVLRPEPDLALTRPRLLDDLLRLALGLPHDLFLVDQPRLLVARLLDDPLRLALGLGEHLLTLLDDPAGLLDLLGDRRPHLVEDVVDLLLVDAHLVGERHGLGVVHRVVELVDQYEDIHTGTSVRQRLSASSRREATRGGTSSVRSPPNIASSFTPLERRKLNCGEDIMYIDSMSGAILRFSWFISNSYSKSEMARRPFTIAFAPFSRAKSTIRLENGLTSTLPRFSTSASMNSTRSSAVNSVFCLRTGWFTTATITLSNTSAARLMMSRWPSVTGSYEPGSTA